MSLGERFRAAREQRGLTLSEVAEHLRIRSVYLAAIEDQDWSAIGAPVYIRGFLRTYARYLGLDPEEAVSEFAATSGQAAPGAAPGRSPALESREQQSLRPVLWIAGIIAAGLVGFVIYLYLSPPRTASVVTAAPASASVTPTASPAPLPTILPVAKTLAIHLTAASWLRIVVDGNVSIEGTFPAGTSKTFHGKTALVRVGNAGGVQISVDGKPLGRLGGSGDVVERSFTM
ncbi:MAG TPA: RodZ domain-containing protein [Candidatus Baltobacteraceae bacterium]|jgi:cytoskeletal protein RodZ|nr:RodZ domain-containing protein [Candidatus Baltobacteraceae bacterium]